MALHEMSMEDYAARVMGDIIQERVNQAMKIKPARKRIEWYLTNCYGKFKVNDVARLLDVSPYQVRYQIKRLGLIHIGQGWYLTGDK